MNKIKQEDIVNYHLDGAKDTFIRTPRTISSIEYMKDIGIEVNTVLDAGVGVCTDFLLKCYPDKKHILFEPLIEWREKCQERYNHEGIEHELYNIALSDHIDKNGNLFYNKTDHTPFIWAGVANKKGEYHGSNHPTRDIDVTTLDNFLKNKNYQGPYFLKIDTDGQELKVLKGATDTLKNCSIIHIESSLYGWDIEKKQHTCSPVWENISWIKDNGFEFFDIVDNYYQGGKLYQVDLIFVKRGDYERIYKKHNNTKNLRKQRINDNLKIQFF